MRRWTAGALLTLGCACATAPPLPAERLGQAEAEVRAAQEIGADRAPQARLHLQEARDTLAAAKETNQTDPEADSAERGDGWVFHAPVAFRLAQVIHHGTDHRSQVCTILSTLGIEPPEIDVWAYGEATGRSRAEYLTAPTG